MALTCDVNPQTQIQQDEHDPLKNMQLQPVDGDGDSDCSSLGDLLSVVPQGRPSHYSFHMIGRDIDSSRQCGVIRNEFVHTNLLSVDVDGAYRESEASLKQRVDALARENESLRWCIEMLEQENQSLRPDQVWMGNKPLYRQRHHRPTITPPRVMQQERLPKRGSIYWSRKCNLKYI